MRIRLQEKGSIEEARKKEMEKLVREILLSKKKKSKDLTNKKNLSDLAKSKDLNNILKLVKKEFNNKIIDSKNE